MIKVSDYIVKRLVGYGIKDVFMISGGGAMHLVDSVSRHQRLNYYCFHHEQAAAIAAEGYFRASGKIAAVVITSGPGGTNTLTGVIGQWLDSIPAIYISGQVKQKTTIAACPGLKLRQVGDQEINIVDIVRPVTKYAIMVRNKDRIKYHLERALYLATHGRQGPVWLDIPLDIQAAIVEENQLISYDPNEDSIYTDSDLPRKITRIIELLKKSQRPVVLAGHGIRLAGAQNLLQEFIETTKIPVLTTFNGYDLLPSDYPYYVGRPGTVGTRFGNFVLQNADLLLSVGSRNNIRQVSYNWLTYARGAKKVIVDIDLAELQKPTVRPDISVCADARRFLTDLLGRIKKVELPNWKWWLGWCIERKKRYPVVLPEYWQKNEPVNPYCFIEILTRTVPKNSILVAGNGTASVTLFQAGIVKQGQRAFWNSGCASMGYDLPAAIGACIASGKKPVVCLAGDGSLQMNIQELQTMYFHRLPIKLFVLNNQGYSSIKQTQDAFFNGHYVASNEESGVSFPDIVKVAKAYGLQTEIISKHQEMEGKIKRILKFKGPIVCEVKLMPDYKFTPKLSSERKPDGRIISRPLEDMYPFLDREEFKNNLLIPK